MQQVLWLCLVWGRTSLNNWGVHHVGGSFRLFLFVHRNAHRLLCSPMLNDVGKHAHRSDIQFRTDHSIPHRPNSSPLLTAIPFGAHAQYAPNVHRMRTECTPNAHSMRTAILKCFLKIMTFFLRQIYIQKANSGTNSGANYVIWLYIWYHFRLPQAWERPYRPCIRQ